MCIVKFASIFFIDWDFLPDNTQHGSCFSCCCSRLRWCPCLRFYPQQQRSGRLLACLPHWSCRPRALRHHQRPRAALTCGYHAIHRVLTRVGLSPKLAYPLPTTDQEVHQIRKLVCEILAAAAEDGKLPLQTARPTTGHASAPRRADTYTDTAHSTAQSPPMPLPSRCSPGDPHTPTIARIPGPRGTGPPRPARTPAHARHTPTRRTPLTTPHTPQPTDSR